MIERKHANIFRALIVAACVAVLAAPILSCKSAWQPAVDASVTLAVTPSPVITALPSPQPTAVPAVEKLPSVLPTPTPSPTPSATPPIDPAVHGKAIVIFTFDDGNVSDFKLAYPILKQYGIRGTSYIVAGFIDDGVQEKMTWAQVKEMNEYGWAFGCHTFDHRALSGLTDKQIVENLEKVDRSFERQGLQKPEIMAYPYGSFNSRVIKAIKPLRKQARLAFYKTKLVDIRHIEPYAIESVSADMRSESQLKSVKKIVDRACREKAVVVFRVHALYETKPYDTVRRNKPLRSGSGPQTSSKLFAKLVKYCVDKGCAFMTMQQLMDLYAEPAASAQPLD